MNENLEKAKKLFFDYSCSTYFMARDGMDSEFKRLGGTEQLAADWRKEYIAYWTSQLSLDDFEALSQLNFAWGVEALPDLIRMCEQAEGYAKLQYADVIWQLSKASSLDEHIRKNAKGTAIKAWEILMTGNFTIPERFQKKIVSKMAPINRTTSENYVVTEAKRQLEKAKE